MVPWLIQNGVTHCAFMAPDGGDDGKELFLAYRQSQWWLVADRIEAIRLEAIPS
jgi:hypothetical protein